MIRRTSYWQPAQAPHRRTVRHGRLVVSRSEPVAAPQGVPPSKLLSNGLEKELSMVGSLSVHRGGKERDCEWCGDPIPIWKKKGTKYHTDDCKDEARKQRRARNR